jgi:hypothetical protein
VIPPAASQNAQLPVIDSQLLAESLESHDALEGWLVPNVGRCCANTCTEMCSSPDAQISLAHPHRLPLICSCWLSSWKVTMQGGVASAKSGTLLRDASTDL